MKNTKLLNVQREVGAIAKDASNPFFKSNYFDINGLLKELKPILNKEGLVVLQPLTELNGKLALATLVIDAESGEKISESICPLPETQDAQKAGSAITYFRRYSLQSLFLLEAKDDDGNDASMGGQGTTQKVKPIKYKDIKKSNDLNI